MAVTPIQFIEADEYEVGRLASSTFGGTGINSQHCVLSNKRLYHKGVTLAAGGAGLQNGENIVNVADITCSGYYIVRHIILLVMGVLMALVLAIAGITSEVTALTIAGLIIGGIFVLLYFTKQQRIFKVCFGGGMLAFEVKGCSEQSLQTFNRLIQQVNAKH